MEIGDLENMLKEYGVTPTHELRVLLKGEDAKIRIPSKVEHKIRRYASKRDLQKVDEDIELAIEIILIVVSNLSNTYMVSFNENATERQKQGFKRLSSVIMMKQVKYNSKESSPYSNALKFLIKYKIIDKGREGSVLSGKATEYRLMRKYYGKGIVSYTLKTKQLLRMRNKQFKENFERVLTTNIGKNSMMMRSKVFFPTDEEVKRKLDRAVSEKYHNKKGKRLLWLGKNSKNTYPETDFVYAEDYLERFQYLRDHMTVPIVSEEGTDARIVDCFNMMPSLIRSLITLHEQKLVETDYSALHPNIVQKYFGGENKEGITHELVAEYLGIDRKTAKIEHLSFFNKEWEHMIHSPLFEYYDKKEPLMMERIKADKTMNGHDNTSRILFKVETNMMEEVVGRLNEKGIFVMYVFDAIYSTEQDQPDVVQVMNEVAQKYRVKTNAVPAKK